jgi:hypothetical protein
LGESAAPCFDRAAGFHCLHLQALCWSASHINETLRFFLGGAGHFPFAFSPSSGLRIKSAADAWQSFSMEASVCLPCDVPQKWSGLKPWQWCRRCSHSGRALGALCPVRASKAVVASLSFPLRLQPINLEAKLDEAADGFGAA